MQTVLIVIHLLLVLALIGLVLLQKSEGGALGMGGGNSNSVFSSRGAANALSRLTAICAGGFFVTSLLLSILAGQATSGKSILDRGTLPAGATAPATPANDDLLKQLDEASKKATPAAPTVPAVPATPQVPLR